MENNKKAVCTTVLIVINVGVFFILSFMGMTEDSMFMLEHGAMYQPYIVEGHEYYRIFTSLFLHFGINHLLNNMVMLGALGWNLELETGRIRFLIIYFISGLGGNLLSLYMNTKASEMVVSAGASGAIFGLMGALVCVVLKNHGRAGRITNRGILFMVALSLYFGFTSSGVDNAAHIGGLVCGFMTAVLIYRRPRADAIY
ncbi:rhomboid family intramembrane serine protease [Faecalicatena sp. AGMB00832]|uniref:Rhomboid family intramembrane serine protease n=1 Tax=Faecalicatena faecalis TaxID=2726362 RepID=A0ABS6D4J1_9FIRM|nr:MULTISPECIES: rhomboid family intramembrane serine protease [Faecalicatena]MBU3876514.1 rhomboid family intramembrane serine protease [Faecalicatena faecalis]MCI6467392.1 rhomboid family intramembrane serine protease [Faecalicatena sp.]MDY5621012.1 rhomboid family intramembrane serine protease [Lachnospiraceae bacterium]